MKKTLPALTPVLKVFQQQQRMLEDATIKFVLPIFASTEDDRYPLGSAILLQIAEKRFLISAAHVFDEHNHAGVNIEVPGQNTFVPLVGRVVKTPLPSSNDRDDDALDIAVMHLSGELVAALSHRTFLDISQVDPSEKPYSHSLYTFTGYPATKQTLPKAGTLMLEPVRYTGMPLHPDKFPAPYSLGQHFGIDYNKQMINREHHVEIAPDPHAISGGGLFRMGTFREINQGKGKIILVGIPVTRKPKCLLATNITVALEMIRAEHPDLTREIPGSTYFKLGITKS